jgi:uncharacterized membrane protein YfcA
VPFDAADPVGLGLLVLVGVAAGVVNTLAGGGSLLTLPALMLLGLPAGVANGTNRLGVLVQSATAAWRFQAAGVLDGRAALRLLPATTLGAALGAWGSLQLGEVGLRRAIAVVMVLVVVALWTRPQRLLRGGGAGLPAAARHAIFFAIGAYGGFVQAGVGVLLLAGLVLAGALDLVRANAIKVLLVLVFTVPALLVFVAEGAVAWVPGLALAAGSAVGGALGTTLALRGGALLVRVVLTGVVALSVIQLWQVPGGAP